MNDRKLLDIALLHKEHNCAAYIMIAFAAEYLEGEMESSRNIFNEYFPKLPSEVLHLMAADGTFSCITEICIRALAFKKE